MLFLHDLYCFLPLLLVFTMKCCVPIHCSQAHNPYCCSLPSPMCLHHLIICTCLNFSPIAYQQSSVLYWCLLCMYYKAIVLYTFLHVLFFVLYFVNVFILMFLMHTLCEFCVWLCIVLCAHVSLLILLIPLTCFHFHLCYHSYMLYKPVLYRIFIIAYKYPEFHDYRTKIDIHTAFTKLYLYRMLPYHEVEQGHYFIQWW